MVKVTRFSSGRLKFTEKKGGGGGGGGEREFVNVTKLTIQNTKQNEMIFSL